MIQFSLTPTSMIGPVGHRRGTQPPTGMAGADATGTGLPALPDLLAGLSGQSAYFTDSAATLRAQSGDPVQVARAGTDLDMLAPDAAGGPILRMDGALPYLDFDGSGQSLSTPVDGLSFPGAVTLGYLLRTTQSAGILTSDSTVVSRAFGIMFNGSASFETHRGLGTPTVEIEGAPFFGNRDDMHMAVSTGAWVKICVSGADLAAWRQFGLSNHSNTSFRFAADIAAGFVLSGAGPAIQAQADAHLDALKALAA